jgi:hypothetical protein
MNRSANSVSRPTSCEWNLKSWTTPEWANSSRAGWPHAIALNLPQIGHSPNNIRSNRLWVAGSLPNAKQSNRAAQTLNEM